MNLKERKQHLKEIGRDTSELQSLAYLVCRLLLEKKNNIKKRIEGGEAADVVIVQPDFAAALAKSGKVSTADGPIIGHVGVGLGNRKGSPAHDISTPE